MKELVSDLVWSAKLVLELALASDKRVSHQEFFS